MGTYYVDNDVGPAGGSGTPADPYGIETAIAAAAPGDVFYWRGGGEGDVSPGHTLNFNKAGTAAAPIRWIGTDDNWNPIVPGQTPSTGVDGNDGPYAIVQILASHQIFEGLRVHNALQGRYGGVTGVRLGANRVLMRNCVVHDCGIGFNSEMPGHEFVQCRTDDVGTGWIGSAMSVLCYQCVVHDTVGHAFRALGGMSLVGCRAHALGGCGVEFYRDHTNPGILWVDHFSVYDCADGVKINAYGGLSASVFLVSNSLFDTCSGYAVSVTVPAGQLGFLLNNGSRNCTSGQVQAGRTGLIQEGWVALPASPFVDAAHGDLALVRSTSAIGAALDGGDLGALQRRFSRLPHPVQW
ncbi:MAG: hypothetical protein V2A79_08560 [Planctomycetota bacterium]